MKPMRAMWLVAVVVMGCHGKETDEILASLRADNHLLRSELVSLRTENAALMANTAGPRWESTVSIKRAGGVSQRSHYQRECPAGQALRGFAARVGGFVDALTPVCTPIAKVPGTRDGRMLERDLPTIGGPSGRIAETMCPWPTLMIGVRGRAADIIDAIEPVCQQSRAAPRVGGGGGRDFERLCPPGWVAIGLTGHQGDYVESVSLTCADPRGQPGYVAKEPAAEPEPEEPISPEAPPPEELPPAEPREGGR